MAAPRGFKTCPRCQHVFDSKAFDLPGGGRSKHCPQCRRRQRVEAVRACASCLRAKPPSAFRRRDGGWAEWCGDCRVSVGRLEGRGHEGEDVDQGTPVAIMGKWLELRERLWTRKLRLGAGFGELADLQLRLASEVLRDLEGLFGPLDRRAQAS